MVIFIVKVEKVEDSYKCVVFLVIVLSIILTQVYSRYPCEKPLIERVFVRTG